MHHKDKWSVYLGGIAGWATGQKNSVYPEIQPIKRLGT